MRDVVVTVAGTREVGPGIVVQGLRWPDAAPTVEPGQFAMLKPRRGDPPLLRRPFGIMTADAEGCEILYDVKGPGTRALAAARPGDELDALVPLGRSFPPPEPGQRAVLVAGGTGLPPLLGLGRHLRAAGVAVTICYGAADVERLVLRDAVAAVDPEARLATDDGSCGHHGLVTGLVPAAAPDLTYYAIGPMPMMRAVATTAGNRPCWVSLEERMACGVGVCMGCATPLADGSIARVCVEGPVFAARELAWTWE